MNSDKEQHIVERSIFTLLRLLTDSACVSLSVVSPSLNPTALLFYHQSALFSVSFLSFSLSSTDCLTQGFISLFRPIYRSMSLPFPLCQSVCSRPRALSGSLCVLPLGAPRNLEHLGFTHLKEEQSGLFSPDS